MGAFGNNLTHRASLPASEKTAPSSPGIKQQADTSANEAVIRSARQVPLRFHSGTFTIPCKGARGVVNLIAGYWSAAVIGASAFLLAGCVAQSPYDAVAVPQTPVAGPVTLGNGWTLNALGSRDQPWCMATIGSQASGVVVVQHTEAGRRAGGHPTLHAALAVGPMGGTIPRGDFLWLALDNDPQPFALMRSANPYAALPAARGAPYALPVQVPDAPRLAAALVDARSARLLARRLGDPAPVTLQTYALPRMPQVVRALEACAREPTNARAIQAAAGVARQQARQAAAPDGGTAGRPAPAGAGDAAAPVWAVPPAAAAAPAASPAPAAAGRAPDPAPAWQAPPAVPAAAPAWVAPPSAAAPAPSPN